MLAPSVTVCIAYCPVSIGFSMYVGSYISIMRVHPNTRHTRRPPDVLVSILIISCLNLQ